MKLLSYKRWFFVVEMLRVAVVIMLTLRILVHWRAFRKLCNFFVARIANFNCKYLCNVFTLIECGWHDAGVRSFASFLETSTTTTNWQFIYLSIFCYEFGNGGGGEKRKGIKIDFACLDEKYNLVEIRYYTAFIIRYMA